MWNEQWPRVSNAMTGDGAEVRSYVVLVALIGCEQAMPDEDRLVNPSALQTTAVSAVFPRSPPPPSPPPPPQLEVTSPPSEIATFLRTHAADAEPWQVTLYELGDGESPPLFMGAHVRRRHALGRAASVQLASWLLQPIYYLDGDCGCMTNVSVGVRIAKGRATLDLVYNAGHLFLTPDGHDGRFVLLADTRWFDRLRARFRL